MKARYWVVLRQFVATYVHTVTLLLYSGFGLALGRHYVVVQCAVLHRDSRWQGLWK